MAKISRLQLLALTTGVSLLLSGCGGGSDGGDANPSTGGSVSGKSGSGDSAGSSGGSSNPSGGERRQDEVWTDADGNKYLGSVPFDAFFDQPHQIASDMTPLNGTAVASMTTSDSGTGMGTSMSSGVGTIDAVPEPANPDTGTEAAVASGGGWDERISAEVLNNEVTSIRNFLTATLQSVGSYNSSMLMIEPKAASVAVLAKISTEHPGEISWKDEAPYIRELAKQMNESPLQRGKKDQARLQKIFENMTDTFNKSRPADLAEPAADDGFSDVAYMSSVMKRMEEAEQRLKVEAGSESSFQSKKDMIRHEAAILRTFTHVISLEEYGYGDDEEFVSYANGVIQATQEITNATEADDFETYDVALSKISTNCQSCHSVFKNN